MHVSAIIELSTPQCPYLACQAVAVVQRRLPTPPAEPTPLALVGWLKSARTDLLFRALVREQIEHHLHREICQRGCLAQDLATSVERELGRELAGRGYPLQRLELRPVLVGQRVPRWPGQFSMWVECAAHVITRDRFVVDIQLASLVTVADRWREEVYVKADVTANLRRKARSLLDIACRGLDAEQVVLRTRWWDRFHSMIEREYADNPLDDDSPLRFLGLTDLKIRGRASEADLMAPRRGYERLPQLLRHPQNRDAAGQG